MLLFIHLQNKEECRVEKKLKKPFLILIFIFLILALGYVVLSYTGNGWATGKINNFSPDYDQIAINTNQVKGRLKMANSDALGFVLSDGTTYTDINGNILDKKPTLEIGQEIKVYYEFVDDNYNVIMIQLQ